MSCFFVTCLRFIDRLFGLLGSSSFAEDAVQEALLSAYKNLEQVRAQARMSTWLTAIVFNSARIHLRTLSRQTHVSLDDCSEGRMTTRYWGDCRIADQVRKTRFAGPKTESI
jgi:DNA-directed RNA polymerase specialized sigma24 family protein